MSHFVPLLKVITATQLWLKSCFFFFLFYLYLHDSMIQLLKRFLKRNCQCFLAKCFSLKLTEISHSIPSFFYKYHTAYQAKNPVMGTE